MVALTITGCSIAEACTGYDAACSSRAASTVAVSRTAGQVKTASLGDCYGTSEEKMLVQYVDKRYTDLQRKYSRV